MFEMKKVKIIPDNSFYLTRFSPMFHFYTPWKRKKTKDFTHELIIMATKSFQGV